MSVHELVAESISIGNAGRNMTDYRLPAIESALRKAVIREKSVGEIEVKIHESEDEITAPIGSPDRIVTCSEQFICQGWIPEGVYYLVKKEEK
jgi:hypothetical protein